MSRILTFVLTASLLSTSAMAADAPGPRPGTVEAMQCLVGVSHAPAECIRMFRGGTQTAARPWVFANPRGGLLSITYWGRASDSNIFDAKAMKGSPVKEMDIFDVKFTQNVEFTFYVSPADAEGKIRGLTILRYAPRDFSHISDCTNGHLCVEAPF